MISSLFTYIKKIEHSEVILPALSFPKYSSSGNSKKSSFITGTLLLTFAGVLTRIIGFFYRIFLSHIIGAEGLGIYQLTAPVMALGFAVTTAGIQTAISRFVSTEIGRKNPEGAKRYLFVGLSISFCLSAVFGIFLHKNAVFLAESWLGDTRCAPLLSVLSLSFVPSCIHACINGYYYGIKKTGIPALTQLSEQFARVGTVYILYQIHLREQTAVPLSITMWGMVLGEVVSTLVSLSFTRLLSGSKTQQLPPSAYAKNLLLMAAPLTANRVVLNLFASYENIMIPNRLRLYGYSTSDALSVYGILTGMSMSVIMFPSVITNSVSVLLLPTIAEAKASGDTHLIRRTLRRTIESCLLLGFLATGAFLVTGDFLGNTLFGNALAGTFITTLAWICPFLYLGATLSSILHGLGFPSLTFVLNLISCGIRIMFVLFAVPIWGIRSYLWGILASDMIQALLAILLLLKLVEKQM